MHSIRVSCAVRLSLHHSAEHTDYNASSGMANHWHGAKFGTDPKYLIVFVCVNVWNRLEIQDFVYQFFPRKIRTFFDVTLRLPRSVVTQMKKAARKYNVLLKG
jgi:hypothetical protein